MKNFNPIKKLTSGLILFSFGFFMVYMVGEKGWEYCEKSVFLFFNGFLPENLAKFISIIFSIALAWYSVKSIVCGGYNVITFNQYLESFDSDASGKSVIVKSNGLYPNINRVLEYRESKMSGMNDRDAADFLNSTSKLDHLYSGYSSGRNTERALNFMESRMAGMNSERGVQYLAGKIS